MVYDRDLYIKNANFYFIVAVDIHLSSTLQKKRFEKRFDIDRQHVHVHVCHVIDIQRLIHLQNVLCIYTERKKDAFSHWLLLYQR